MKSRRTASGGVGVLVGPQVASMLSAGCSDSDGVRSVSQADASEASSLCGESTESEEAVGSRHYAKLAAAPWPGTKHPQQRVVPRACAPEKLRLFVAACWRIVGQGVIHKLGAGPRLDFGSLCAGLEVGGMAIEAIKECLDSSLAAKLRLTMAAEIADRKRRVVSDAQLSEST